MKKKVNKKYGMKRKLKWIQQKIMRKKTEKENEADNTSFIKAEKIFVNKSH